MDAGWLRTYDEYYDHNAQYIFDTVFEELQKKPDHKYTLGDIVFFQRYYRDLTDRIQDTIKELVKKGQLDIVHGGLVSTDEACPNYTDILRNFEEGHAFLKEEFGIKPKIAWQLDPFGHSAANAELLAELGLEIMVFSRMNEQEAKHRRLEQDLQFIWEPSFYNFEDDQLSEASSQKRGIFAHVLFDHYNPPKAFVQSDLLKRGFSYMPIHNSPDQWLEYFWKHTIAYKTRNVLVMWGEDFAHERAHETFEWLDQIITDINAFQDLPAHERGGLPAFVFGDSSQVLHYNL